MVKDGLSEQHVESLVLAVVWGVCWVFWVLCFVLVVVFFQEQVKQMSVCNSCRQK